LLFSILFSGLAFGQNKNQELYKAITQKNVEQVVKLLNDSADANYVISAGTFKMNMLNTAINVSKNKSIVELLLKNKADVNWKDAFNTTALMYAASSGDLELVELLLSYGADVKANDGQGNSVLSAAKESKNKTLIKLIDKKLKEQN
jgi:ankyrin repeat protein